MRFPLTISLLILLCFAFPHAVFPDDEPQHGPSQQALAAFDDSVNGSTRLVEDIPKANRNAIIADHRVNEAQAFDDYMCAIDDEMWYGYAKKEGWLNDD